MSTFCYLDLGGGLLIIPSEATEQKCVAEYLRLRGILFCHVPNEGKRHPVTGMNQRKLGLMKGFPDLIIFDPPPKMKNIKGVAIEMKRVKRSHLSASQKEWLTALERRGWAVRVCRGCQEALNWLNELGY